MLSSHNSTLVESILEKKLSGRCNIPVHFGSDAVYDLIGKCLPASAHPTTKDAPFTNHEIIYAMPRIL